MSDPFIGEIRIFSFNFAPKGYAFCDGGLMELSENPALFSLYGTTFGGNGSTTFGLPDLRGRIPLGSTQYYQGQYYGYETIPIYLENLPIHSHTVNVSTSGGDKNDPEGMYLAKSISSAMYADAENLVNLNDDSVSYVGEGQWHSNI